LEPIILAGFIFLDMACSLSALIRKRELRSWRRGGRRYDKIETLVTEVYRNTTLELAAKVGAAMK
jgi:hypothetical protein